MNRPTLRSRPVRALLAPVLVPVLVPVLLLAGCGSDDDPEAAPSGDAAASEDPHGGPETWNPCDGIDVAQLSATLGAEVAADRGTSVSPRCALLPAAEGGPVLDANYMIFPGGLDAAWRTMGAPDDGSISEPSIRGADAARVVVSADDAGVTATGFVQNGDLIHVVNAADTSPYDRRALVRGIEAAMTQLSAHANEAAQIAEAE